MRLLLDTHAFLWWVGNDPALAADAREAIADPDAFVAFSAASAWEMSIKAALGRLRVPPDLERVLARSRFVPLAIEVRHALRAGSLPLHHRDLFDRMLIAQAQLEGMTIVTRDPAIARYSVATLAA